MRHLVISDLHERYDYLDSALRQAHDMGGFDDIWFLGDVVGHCGDACERDRCIRLLQERHAVCVRGNWEYWLLRPEADSDDPEGQSPHAYALSAIRKELPPGTLEFLSTWPTVRTMGCFTLAHGVPSSEVADPDRDQCESYIYPESFRKVDRIFQHALVSTSHVVLGHTHLAGMFHHNGHQPRWQGLKPEWLAREQTVDGMDGRYVINPGTASDSSRRGGSEYPTALVLATEANNDRFTFRYLRLTR